MKNAPIRQTGSHFADISAAREAVRLALPMIEPATRDPSICGSGFLVIVVMDPALQPGDAPFDEAVLLEHCVGDRAAWDADYSAFARGKARLSWETGLAGQALHSLHPHLLREGDSLLAGSAVLEGIVVGASGAEAWWDEAFATAVAANLRAIARQRHVAARQAGKLSAA